ncbi:glycosyl transferase family 2, partial [Yersinia enterocolitica]|nr:glycosyl transferase family 2 [Yersinia enterocolitica]
EYLDADNDFLIGIPQIKINHTGYLSEVYHDKNKFFRNKNLLSKQIFLEPENPRWKYFMLRYLACDDTEYSSILDFFASLPLPYEPSIEVYALNVKIMLIKKLMHENKYHDAHCHAQVLFEHYTDKITALLYSSCKYFEAKNKFMLIINEVETIYS